MTINENCRPAWSRPKSRLHIMKFLCAFLVLFISIFCDVTRMKNIENCDIWKRKDGRGSTQRVAYRLHFDTHVFCHYSIQAICSLPNLSCSFRFFYH